MNLEVINDLADAIKSEVAETQSASLSAEEEVLLEEMIRAGVIYGRKKSKTNPRMGKYIFGARKGVEIFDIIQTLHSLEKSALFLKEKINKKAFILTVGTQPSAKDLLRKFSEKLGFPYVVERWLGGTLTNFKVIGKRIDYFIKLKADKATGRLEKYTKKERLKIDEQIQKLAKILGGMEKMNQLPEAIFVIDAEEHSTAIREAYRLKIPVVAIASSDTNPDKIDYLIPANDNARSSLSWILEYLEKKLIMTDKINV